MSERETIEGRMHPVAERPRLRPRHGVLAVALASLTWSLPRLFGAAFAFGTRLGDLL